MLYSCNVCFEGHAEEDITAVHGSLVCHECVCQMFERAVESEQNYPPKWGNRTLKIRDFGRIIPRELRRRLEEKEEEYNTAPVMRVYCNHVNPDIMIDIGEEGVPCGAFVGGIPKDWAKKFAAGESAETRCKKCETQYCMKCAEPLRLHVCTNPGPKANDEAFEGLERGKHYQICPSSKCLRRIELRDGCNHVVCRCGTSFCFICGNKAGRDHWSTAREHGGCPRYGQPSSVRAIWDSTPGVELGRAPWWGPRPPNLHAPRRRNAILGLPPNEEADIDGFVRELDGVVGEGQTVIPQLPRHMGVLQATPTVPRGENRAENVAFVGRGQPGRVAEAVPPREPPWRRSTRGAMNHFQMILRDEMQGHLQRSLPHRFRDGAEQSTAAAERPENNIAASNVRTASETRTRQSREGIWPYDFGIAAQNNLERLRAIQQTPEPRMATTEQNVQRYMLRSDWISGGAQTTFPPPQPPALHPLQTQDVDDARQSPFQLAHSARTQPEHATRHNVFHRPTPINTTAHQSQITASPNLPNQNHVQGGNNYAYPLQGRAQYNPPLGLYALGVPPQQAATFPPVPPEESLDNVDEDNDGRDEEAERDFERGLGDALRNAIREHEFGRRSNGRTRLTHDPRGPFE